MIYIYNNYYYYVIICSALLSPPSRTLECQHPRLRPYRPSAISSISEICNRNPVLHRTKAERPEVQWIIFSREKHGFYFYPQKSKVFPVNVLPIHGGDSHGTSEGSTLK